MNALIGLDREADGTPILELFARLGFEDCRVTLAYAAEPRSGRHNPRFNSGDYIDQGGARSGAAVALTAEEDAHQMLDLARDVLYRQGIHSTHVILHGHPASALIEAADQLGASLVGAAATKFGPIRCAVFGSVCRALTIGAHQSVLIAKDMPTPDKPLTAVFATDHSTYCDKAIDALYQMNPMGIQKLVIMSAVAPKGYDELWASYGLPESEQATLTLNREKVTQRNAAIAERFRGLNMETSVAVIDKPVRDGINEVMADNNADLLILAAQGHGFVERMTIGSVSLHEAVAEPHSLLILRP